MGKFVIPVFPGGYLLTCSHCTQVASSRRNRPRHRYRILACPLRRDQHDRGRQAGCSGEGTRLSSEMVPPNNSLQPTLFASHPRSG